jgi:hypothetical protein
LEIAIMVYCLVLTFNAHGFTKHKYYYASRDGDYISNFSRNFTRQTKRMQKVSENDKLMFIQMRNLVSNIQSLFQYAFWGGKMKKAFRTHFTKICHMFDRIF